MAIKLQRFSVKNHEGVPHEKNQESPIKLLKAFQKKSRTDRQPTRIMERQTHTKPKKLKAIIEEPADQVIYQKGMGIKIGRKF